MKWTQAVVGGRNAFNNVKNQYRRTGFKIPQHDKYEIIQLRNQTALFIMFITKTKSDNNDNH